MTINSNMASGSSTVPSEAPSSIMGADGHLIGPLSTRGPGNISLRPELKNLKVIGVEEHTTFPSILSRIPKSSHSDTVLHEFIKQSSMAYAHGRTAYAGAQRLKDMDEGNISVQILSLGGALNSMLLPGDEGVQLARDINDELKKMVDRHPSRFRALAELPMHIPGEAIRELHRCVKGLGFVGALVSGSISGEGKFLDGREYEDLLAAFEELDVPLFLHPGIPPKPVWDMYYKIDADPAVSAAFGLAGWGWHNEVAIHVLRLALSGALDRHRGLKIVVGHQGEMMPMMMNRFDSMFDERIFGFKRSVAEMLREQVWIAISGLFSVAPTQVSIATWGVDRVLFANDYPFQDAQRVPEFLSALGDVIAPSDLRKVCQTNAEELFKFKA